MLSEDDVKDLLLMYKERVLRHVQRIKDDTHNYTLDTMGSIVDSIAEIRKAKEAIEALEKVLQVRDYKFTVAVFEGKIITSGYGRYVE